MSFECFKETVMDFIRRAGEKTPTFINDEEHIRYVAITQDEVIIARPSSGSISVRRRGSKDYVVVKVA